MQDGPCGVEYGREGRVGKFGLYRRCKVQQCSKG